MQIRTKTYLKQIMTFFALFGMILFVGISCSGMRQQIQARNIGEKNDIPVTAYVTEPLESEMVEGDQAFVVEMEGAISYRDQLLNTLRNSTLFKQYQKDLIEKYFQKIDPDCDKDIFDQFVENTRKACNIEPENYEGILQGILDNCIDHCPICLNIIVHKPYHPCTECKNPFHESCFTQYIGTQQESLYCPLCRYKIPFEGKSRAAAAAVVVDAAPIINPTNPIVAANSNVTGCFANSIRFASKVVLGAGIGGGMATYFLGQVFYGVADPEDHVTPVENAIIIAGAASGAVIGVAIGVILLCWC